MWKAEGRGENAGVGGDLLMVFPVFTCCVCIESLRDTRITVRFLKLCILLN